MCSHHRRVHTVLNNTESVLLLDRSARERDDHVSDERLGPVHGNTLQQRHHVSLREITS